jgi:hypothetical protein
MHVDPKYRQPLLVGANIPRTYSPGANVEAPASNTTAQTPVCDNFTGTT